MSNPSLGYLRLVLTTGVCIAALAGCTGDDVGDGTTGSTGATAASATSGMTSDGSSDTTSSPTSDATSSPTSDATSNPTSDATSDGTESASSTNGGPTSTGDATGTTEDLTTSTSGGTTGVALTGLEAFCAHYVECGGTYYEDEGACIDASLGYWGECPSRRDALDAFGACMNEIPCDEWNPDAYNPAGTDCADEWKALGESEPC